MVHNRKAMGCFIEHEGSFMEHDVNLLESGGLFCGIVSELKLSHKVSTMGVT